MFSHSRDSSERPAPRTPAGSGDPAHSAGRRFADKFPRLLPFGDAAILVEFGDAISPAVNARVRALDAALASAALPGMVETIPAYRSLLVEYDPGRVSYSDMELRLAAIAAQLGNAPPLDAPLKPVPTVYGGEF